MTPSRLCNAHNRLIVDASVLINLLGTGAPLAILHGLNRVFEIDEIALQEVGVNPATRGSAEGVLNELRKAGVLKVVQMSSKVYDRFLAFAGADAPDDLDDGEAATLAHASSDAGYVAVIDEKKATRIAAAHKPAIEVLNSLDLLGAPELIAKFGEDYVAEAVYFALRDARMRVPHWARQWTAMLVGYPRAAECPGLGEYSRSRSEVPGPKPHVES